MMNASFRSRRSTISAGSRGYAALRAVLVLALSTGCSSDGAPSAPIGATATSTGQASTGQASTGANGGSVGTPIGDNGVSAGGISTAATSGGDTSGSNVTGASMTASASSSVGGSNSGTGGSSATTTIAGSTTSMGGNASTTTASGGAAGIGGVGGASATSGATAGAGGTTGGDPLPPRPLAVTAPQARHEHSFRASDADPSVTFNDNTQVAVLDTRASTLVGKLVLPFGGVGTNNGILGGGGEFCARRGFHVLGIAAFQDYDIVSFGADFFGDARRQVFEGEQHTREGAFANIEMTPADGVARRTEQALQYLHSMFPEEDWGYYLQGDGSVRWSDVIFTGMSHGGSNAARFAMLVRASRVVSFSAPRDNLCTRLDSADCGGLVATWLSETPQTPIDRFYALTGSQDGQHLQHLFFMQELGYTGEPTNSDGAAPPFGGSHQLVTNAGHEDFCNDGSYQTACNYLFGVPTENHEGTPP